MSVTINGCVGCVREGVGAAYDGGLREYGSAEALMPCPPLCIRPASIVRQLVGSRCTLRRLLDAAAVKLPLFPRHDRPSARRACCYSYELNLIRCMVPPSLYVRLG